MASLLDALATRQIEHFIDHLQNTEDPVIRENMVLKTLQVDLLGAEVHLPLPTGAGIKFHNTHNAYLFMEAKEAYELLLNLANIQYTDDEQIQQMTQSTQLVNMSVGLYDELCTIFKTCDDDGIHKWDCPKIYVTMRLMTYWYLYHIFYKMLHPPALIELGGITPNPIRALRQRELTGKCSISRRIDPAVIEDLTTAHIREQEAIYESFTLPEGLMSKLCTFLEPTYSVSLRKQTIQGLQEIATKRYNCALTKVGSGCSTITINRVESFTKEENESTTTNDQTP